MPWPEKKTPELDAAEKKTLGKGVFRKCDGCGVTLASDAFAANFEVCPQCGQHHKLSGSGWRQLLLDDGLLEEWDAHLEPADPLQFVDGRTYPERVASAQKASRAREGMDIGRARIDGRPIAWGAFLFAFMGGSMGSVVGERFVRGVRVSYENRIPFVCITSSGGARMQEGVSSLFQMAKTTAVLQELSKARLPFVSILTDPTMGGVSASFAMIGDIVIAEPGALIGFAGPRVIEQTVREKLPEGFQRAEFLLEKGAIDMIVDRRQLNDELPRLLTLLQRQPLPSG
jgi:acetyl-CoA carboxylase carboxyl transferase subunit beta